MKGEVRPSRIYRAFLIIKDMVIEWKDVLGYEGRYKVSNLGQVKSIIKRGEKLLNGSISPDGYHQFTLQWKAKGKRNVYGGHQLVAMAFLGHRPNGTSGYVVDHIDDNRSNNKLINLQIVTNHFNTVKRFNVKRKFGVHKDRNKFVSKVWFNGEMVRLGAFSTEDEAHKRTLKFLEENNIKRLIY